MSLNPYDISTVYSDEDIYEIMASRQKLQADSSNDECAFDDSTEETAKEGVDPHSRERAATDTQDEPSPHDEIMLGMTQIDFEGFAQHISTLDPRVVNWQRKIDQLQRIYKQEIVLLCRAFAALSAQQPRRFVMRFSCFFEDATIRQFIVYTSDSGYKVGRRDHRPYAFRTNVPFTTSEYLDTSFDAPIHAWINKDCQFDEPPQDEHAWSFASSTCIQWTFVKKL